MSGVHAVVEIDVSAEVAARLWSSVRRKGAAVLIGLLSLLFLNFLDDAKLLADRDRPVGYSRYKVTTKFLSSLDQKKFTELRAAANVRGQERSFDTSEGLFTDLIDNSPAVFAIRDRADDKVDKIDAKLQELIDGDLSDASSRIETLRARRAATLEQRDNNLTQLKTKLSKQYAEVSSLALIDSRFFGLNWLQELADSFLNQRDPLHTIYDLLWYAALVLAVLGFSYALLMPLFRLLPFTGAEDQANRRFEDLFKRGQMGTAGASTGVISMLSSSIAIVGTLAIGAASVADTVKNAANSPFNHDTPPVAQKRPATVSLPPGTATAASTAGTTVTTETDTTDPAIDNTIGTGTVGPTTTETVAVDTAPVTDTSTRTGSTTPTTTAIVQPPVVQVDVDMEPFKDALAVASQQWRDYVDNKLNEAERKEILRFAALEAANSTRAEVAAELADANRHVIQKDIESTTADIQGNIQNKAVAQTALREKRSVTAYLLGRDRFVITPLTKSTITAVYGKGNVMRDAVVSGSSTLGDEQLEKIGEAVCTTIDAMSENELVTGGMIESRIELAVSRAASDFGFSDGRRRVLAIDVARRVTALVMSVSRKTTAPSVAR